MPQCFVTTLLKWRKYKNILTFAYYSITFWDFKSLQGIPKVWQKLKAKNNFLKKMSKYRNTVWYDFKSRFFVIFYSICRHRLVLKIPFPDHIFPTILKYHIMKIFISHPPANTMLPPSDPPPPPHPTPKQGGRDQYTLMFKFENFNSMNS